MRNAVQLGLFDAIEETTKQCLECGESFDFDESCPQRLCERCISDAEAQAVFVDTMAEIRNRRHGYEKDDDKYEAELMAVPGSRRRQALENFRG